MKYLIILFTIALAGLASCTTQYPSEYPWGVEKDGIKTRLIPEKKIFTLGEPLMFRLEMTNIGDAQKSYDAQGIDVNDQMLIKDAKGGIVKYVDTSYQTASGRPLPIIKPGQIVCLFSDFDIAVQYHICKLGKYTIQFKGKDEAFGKVVFPASNIVEIEVKDGKLNDFDSIRCRLLHIMPEDWGMYLTTEFGVHEEIGKLRKQGLIVEKYFIILLPPQKGTVHQILVWHTKTPMDITTIKEQKRPYSQPVPIPEYLGRDQWGHAYWEYTPEAIKLWPKAKEDIIKALGIESDFGLFEQMPIKLGDSEVTLIQKMKGIGARDVTSLTRYSAGRRIAGEQKYYWWELEDKTIVSVLLAGDKKDNLKIIVIEVGEPGKGIAGIDNWRVQKLKRYDYLYVIVKQLVGAEPPATAREIAVFEKITDKMDMADVFRTVGVPDRDMGSGIYQYIYELSDDSHINIGTPDNKSFSVVHTTKDGKSRTLVNKGR